MTVPIQWRIKTQRYRLRGRVCPVCSQVMFPPRGVCPHCAGEHGANGHHPHAVALAAPLATEQLVVSSGGDD